MPPHGTAHRPAVGSSRGIVTYAHFLASMAGAEMLLQGGNAMDAVVATSAALNVVAELMLSPTQGFRDGRCVLSIGTPGSFGILQTTPQMILNHLEFGLDIQEAIEAPRVRVYRDRLLDVEARIPESMRAALAARGPQVNVLDEHGGWSWVVGGAHGIARDPESGALTGGADPRRDGAAVAV
jgi:gamma-glutamyltranspeptidase